MFLSICFTCLFILSSLYLSLSYTSLSSLHFHHLFFTIITNHNHHYYHNHYHDPHQKHTSKLEYRTSEETDPSSPSAAVRETVKGFQSEGWRKADRLLDLKKIAIASEILCFHYAQSLTYMS